MSTDAIVLLREDHREIRKLFRDFAQAGENAVAEHHVADVLCAELAAMSHDDEHFAAKDDGPHRERHPPQGRGGAGLVPEGPGRPQPQDIGARMLELKEKAPRSPSRPSALRKAVDAVLS